MYKLTFCLRRKHGMSVEEFQRYWRNTHAPLVAARAETLGIRRYVQAHTADRDVLAGHHYHESRRRPGVWLVAA